MAEVPPSGIRKFFDVVSEMKGVVSLGVGEPDFNTPWGYSDAAIYSLRKGHTHYTSNWGLLELRKAIAEYMEMRFQVEYDPKKQILVTVGASEGIDIALRALVEPGDEVLVPDPSYVSYAPGVTFAGGVCVPVRTDAEHAFKLTPEALREVITPKTKAMILPYPNNPTGAVMTRADMEAIAAVLRETNIIVISDEIYAELTYEGKHVCFAEIPGMWERTITLNGFSKAFAMTGWRLGYAVWPGKLYDFARKLAVNLHSCVNASAQYAGLAALNGPQDEVTEMIAEFDRRRKVVVDGLNKLPGVSCATPKGAFYAFPNIKQTGWKAKALASSLLEDAGVAIIGGPDFGILGEGYVRLSYANSTENILKALDRMGEFLSTRKAA